MKIIFVGIVFIQLLKKTDFLALHLNPDFGHKFYSMSSRKHTLAKNTEP
jgi:hypothetical protein